MSKQEHLKPVTQAKKGKRAKKMRCGCPSTCHLHPGKGPSKPKTQTPKKSAPPMKKQPQAKAIPPTKVEAKLESILREAAPKAATKKTRLKGTKTGIPRLTGHGDYSDVGSQLGGALGTLAEVVMMGMGDYTPKTNSLIHGAPIGLSHMGVPDVSANGTIDTGVRIRHREYIGDIYCGDPGDSDATPYTLQSFDINPGNQTLFPWLSLIAARFDWWIPNGMVISFISQTSNFSSTSILGSYGACHIEDPTTPDPEDKIEFLNTEGAISAAPYENLYLGIECARDSSVIPHFYITLDQNFGGTGSPINFNKGKVFIFTQGLPASASESLVAQMWVSYDIWLKNPLTRSALPYGDGANFIMSHPTSVGGFYFGTDVFVGAFGNNPGFVFTLIGGDQVCMFPEGENIWQVTYHVTLPTPSVSAPGPLTLNLLNGFVVAQQWASGGAVKNSSFSYDLTKSGSDSVSWTYCWIVHTKGKDQMWLTLDSGVYAWSGAAGDLTIYQNPEPKTEFLGPGTSSLSSVLHQARHTTRATQNRIRAATAAHLEYKEKLAIRTFTEDREAFLKEVRQQVIDSLSGATAVPTSKTLARPGTNVMVRSEDRTPARPETVPSWIHASLEMQKNIDCDRAISSPVMAPYMQCGCRVGPGGRLCPEHASVQDRTSGSYEDFRASSSC